MTDGRAHLVRLHIAIATGIGAKCYSTDILRPGYFDLVPIEGIRNP